MAEKESHAEPNGKEKMDGTKMEEGESFCLDDYDCIGFDMDHTVVQYHIEELFKVKNYNNLKWLISGPIYYNLYNFASAS